ncbi:Transcription factor [Seminavis robusta]|uniref:Transcription factor n=1 Tax=Seminavis robusta TaxID=568900 RepID=A0A9N8H6U9_9STRA|nr:Transcription factor [Seminavis robusta]|eukprot:Sro182_g079300.1 Transcription factor (405) ;mRNA; r:27006-28220
MSEYNMGTGKRKRDELNAAQFPPSYGSASTSDASEEGDKWSEELHRSFVAAIFDAGVSQSSPSVILENMACRPDSLTSERVKSHLQKYRKNKEKSREDFLKDYDDFVRKAMTVGGTGATTTNHIIMPPSAMISTIMGEGRISGGDIAAFLTYSVMTEGQAKAAPTAGGGGSKPISSVEFSKESQDYLKIFAGTHVPFPKLTEEEKRSPLGISMVYVMGLFSSLSQYMVQERRKRSTRPFAVENPDDAPANAPPAVNHSTYPTESANVPQHQQQQPKRQRNESSNPNPAAWLVPAAAAPPPAAKQQTAPLTTTAQHVGQRGTPVVAANSGNTPHKAPAPIGFFFPVLDPESTRPNPSLQTPAPVGMPQSAPVPVVEARASGQYPPPGDGTPAASSSGPNSSYAQV